MVDVTFLKNFNYQDSFYEKLWVILGGDGSPPILPLLFTSHFSRYGIVYERQEAIDPESQKRLSILNPREISASTIRTYVYNLAKFLDYLERDSNSLGIHFTSSCSQRMVNAYLNHYLPTQLKSSTSLSNHCAALRAYFNWLNFIEISAPIHIRIDRKTRQKMAESHWTEKPIQYISSNSRNKLITTCNSLSEKLILRLGFEVGLRTSELVGLRLNDGNGIEKLFASLDDDNQAQRLRFKYWLKGKYTKGGKSRWIYFDRPLLQDMKRYYLYEREEYNVLQQDQDTSFFLRTNPAHRGLGISVHHGSKIFRKIATKVGLNPKLKFHDLRHTFATELYHEELRDSHGNETRSESAALIVVAQRLGHAFLANGLPSPVTTKYIRLHLQMEEIEGIRNVG